jgi:long-chain acyl-CoA synthetase
MTASITRGALSRLLDEHPGAPDEPVLHTLSDSVTLSELRTAVDALADQLMTAGVNPGDAVAVVIDDGFGAVTAAFAIWRAGAVLVPLNARVTARELTDALAGTRPAAVIARVPVTVNAPVLTRIGPLGWTDATGDPAPDPVHYGGEAAIVTRTSGTTGPPKSVVLRHDGMIDGIDTVARQLRSRSLAQGRPPMPNLIPTSLALGSGLWNALFGLRVGAPLVLLDRFEPVAFAELVRRFEIRSSILAPAMMSMLVQDLRINDLAPLRSVRSVTAPLTPVQARAFRDRFNVAVMISYGQTELGGEVVGWTAADVREHGEDKLGSVGRAHPGVAIRVLDDEQRELGVDQVGEIWISSPFLSAPDPAMLARTRDGFLQTGDLGRLDADGFLWLDGRVSDLVNRGGLKVVPQEVEEALRAQPGVADACVAGVPDDRLGEVPVAWIVPYPGAKPAAAALIGALRAELAAYKIPVDFVLIDELPRSEIGKILRRELTNNYQREILQQ